MAANVMFKRGLHANLPTSGIVDGSFYLTTDTNRLYIGQNNKLVELNKSITAVSTSADLPKTNVAEGQFYYITTGNILAYYNGTEWVQINPDATLNGATDALNTGKKLPEGDNHTGGTEISLVVRDTEGNTSQGSFGIVGKGATKVSQYGNNTLIESHDSQFTIATKPSVTDGIVSLNKDGTENSSILIKGGAGITVTSDGVGNVTIDKDAEQSQAVTEVGVMFGATGNPNGGMNGGAVAPGELEVAVRSAGEVVRDKVKPLIAYGDKETAFFDGGTAVLDVYTKAQVDKLIDAADALVFRGIVPETIANLPDITTAQNGDTYKVSSKGSYGGHAANAGDLIIAFGEEDPVTGKLKAGSEWIVIPSGDDQTISGVIDTSSNYVGVKDQESVIASIELTNGGSENISISSTGTSNDLVTTIKHTEAGAIANTVEGSTDNIGPNDPKGTVAYNAITKLEYDANGHVVGAETRSVAFTDTHNRPTRFDITTSGGATADEIGGSAEVTYTYNDVDGNDYAPVLTVNSQSLRVMQNSGTLSVDMVWDTF